MKRILTLTLAACLALCMMMCAVACDDAGEDTTDSATDTATETAAETPTESESETTENTKKAYTVSVVDDEGNPVNGVAVKICVGESCQLPRITDATGQVTFSIDNPENLEIGIQILGKDSPEGYDYPTDKILTDDTTVTVTVSRADVPTPQN